MAEGAGAWGVVMRRVGVSLTLYSLPPAAFLVAYLAIYRAPGSAIVPHVWVALSVGAAIAATRLCIGLLPIDRRIRTLMAAGLLTAVVLATLGFYGLVAIGLQYWGRVTSVDLVSTYVPQVGDVLRTLGYSPWLVVVAGVAVIALVWFAIYRFLVRFDWVERLQQQVPRTLCASAVLLLTTIAAVSAAEFPYRDWGSRGEPLSLSVFPERGQTAMQSHAIGNLRSAELDRVDAIERAAYRPAATAKHSNVIVIVVDALRADHLSLFGYPRATSPRLDALVKTGALRLKTTVVTACNESACGLRALSSSRYVDEQAARPITLQEVLKKHGYRIHMLLSGDHTHFYGLRETYGAVDTYFDGASQHARYVNDDRLVIDRLREFGAWDGHPTMFQFHLMSTHALGNRLESTPEFGPSENYDRLGWRPKDADMQKRAINYYDRGVLQTDQVVSDLLATLEAQGYLRDALVVLTGDHGESLGERGRYSHAHSVWEESLRVPLVMLAFGAANVDRLDGGVVASQVDIAPTLARALDMPTSSTWQGLPLQTHPANRIVYFQQAQQIGLIDARDPGGLFKHWDDVDRAHQYTFDLSKDPGEKVDITSQVPDALRTEWKRLLLARSSAIVTDGEGRHERALKGDFKR